MAIQNHAQARTAKQYLEILNAELMSDDISIEDIIRKTEKAADILEGLQQFHLNSSIKLVVNNSTR